MSHRGEDKALTELLGQAYESVASKKALIAALDAHPAVAASASMDSPYELGFAACLDKFRPDVDCWGVKLYSALGSTTFQVTDPSALRAFLEGEIERVRNPAKAQSPKVLAKMVSVRLRRAIDDAQAIVAQARANLESTRGYREECLRRTDPAWWLSKENAYRAPGETRTPQEVARDNADGAAKQVADHDRTIARLEAEMPDCVPDLRTATRRSLGEWAGGMRRGRGNQRNFVELENFLARPDVTDEMARMACDMVLVEEVMGS